MPVNLPLVDGEAPELGWIKATLAGDLSGFERIMRQYNQRLFRIARSILKDEHAARDALQEGYIKAFRKLDSFEGPTGFTSWISRIVANEALQKLRATKPELPLDDTEPAALAMLNAMTPERHASNEQLRALMTDLIDALPHQFRTVFVMRVIEQISGPEVAQILGIPQATVKTRLHRARQTLKRQINQKLEATQLSVFEFAGQRCDGLVADVIEKLEEMRC